MLSDSLMSTTIPKDVTSMSPGRSITYRRLTCIGEVQITVQRQNYLYVRRKVAQTKQLRDILEDRLLEDFQLRTLL